MKYYIGFPAAVPLCALQARLRESATQANKPAASCAAAAAAAQVAARDAHSPTSPTQLIQSVTQRKCSNLDPDIH